MQTICLMNIERGSAIPIGNITEQVEGRFSFSSGGNVHWEVNIPNGTCTCPSFLSSHIPCKHMFAVFYHYPQWKWDDLPLELTTSSHIILDHDATSEVNGQNMADNMDKPSNSEDQSSITEFPSPNVTTSLPTKISNATQVYRLQKHIEEILGQCRTLAFMICDLQTLQIAAEQCQSIKEKLSSSATTSLGSNIPPIFHGIQAFQQPRKAIQRKRKCSYTKSQNKYAKTSIVSTSDALAKVSKNTPGRPRLKRIQRKNPALPRQVSTPTKSKMLKAAALLRRGMLLVL